MREEKVMEITIKVLFVFLAIFGVGYLLQNMYIIVGAAWAAGGSALLVWLPAMLIAGTLDVWDDIKKDNK